MHNRSAHFRIFTGTEGESNVNFSGVASRSRLRLQLCCLFSMPCQYFLLQQPSRASHFGRSKAFLTFKQNILIYRQIGSEGSRL